MPEQEWSLVATAAAAVWGYVTLVWLVSLALRDAGVMDVAWGPGFVLAAGTAAVAGGVQSVRGGLVLALTAVWAFRLAGYIFVRNRGRGEDPRYARWRREAGPAFWWRSYFKVFLLQGVVLVVVALPLLVAVTAPEPTTLTPFDLAGIGLWLAGFLFEAVADAQLRRFKRRPENRGKVMTTGLWRYTRHPNYFGEAVLWWGFGLMACSVSGGWVTLAGPALMTWLLVRVSGVAMLERDLMARRPGYADYVRTTNAFFPGRPRRPAG